MLGRFFFGGGFWEGIFGTRRDILEAVHLLPFLWSVVILQRERLFCLGMKLEQEEKIFKFGYYSFHVCSYSSYIIICDFHCCCWVVSSLAFFLV